MVERLSSKTEALRPFWQKKKKKRKMCVVGEQRGTGSCPHFSLKPSHFSVQDYDSSSLRAPLHVMRDFASNALQGASTQKVLNE
jgi:hypothetical protein